MYRCSVSYLECEERYKYRCSDSYLECEELYKYRCSDSSLEKFRQRNESSVLVTLPGFLIAYLNVRSDTCNVSWIGPFTLECAAKYGEHMESS